VTPFMLLGGQLKFACNSKPLRRQSLWTITLLREQGFLHRIKNNRISTLTEKERAKSFERFRVLQPRIEDQISFTTISNKTGVSVSTLKRWMQRYRECGLIGLARKSRSD
ncbi:MAG: helix-turn-helix domain-containing protein, partial [Calditrichales bacterium]|nr:helix-turn-helix domain-containing protein [Calditrichales bacterium]